VPSTVCQIDRDALFEEELCDFEIVCCHSTMQRQVALAVLSL
jgi:hypothetical protein